MGISDLDPGAHQRRLWNAGSFVGAKRPLKPRDVWAIRFYLNEHRRLRDRALFDLAIDSKLRGCDIVKMKIGDVVAGGSIRNRATIIQQKTSRPVQFELMADARSSLLAWLEHRKGSLEDFLFPAGLVALDISAPGNTPGLSANGRQSSGLTPKSTELIRCAGPRLR